MICHAVLQLPSQVLHYFECTQETFAGGNNKWLQAPVAMAFTLLYTLQLLSSTHR